MKEPLPSTEWPYPFTNNSKSISRSTDHPRLDDGTVFGAFESMVRQQAASTPNTSFTFRSDRPACFELAPILTLTPDLTSLSEIAKSMQQGSFFQEGDKTNTEERQLLSLANATLRTVQPTMSLSERTIAPADPSHPALQRVVFAVPQSSFDFRNNSSASFEQKDISPISVRALDFTGLAAIANELQSGSLTENRLITSTGLWNAAVHSARAEFGHHSMHNGDSSDTAAVTPVQLEEGLSEGTHSRRVSDGSSYQTPRSPSDAGSMSSVDSADEASPHISTNEGSIPSTQFVADPICLYLDQNSKLADEPATLSIETVPQEFDFADEEYDEHGNLVSPGLDLIIAANYLDLTARANNTRQDVDIGSHETFLWQPKPERLAVGENHILNHTPGRLARFAEHIKTPSTVASSARQCYAIMSPSRCGAIDFPPPTPSIIRNLGKVPAALEVFDTIRVPCRPYRAKTSNSYEVVGAVIGNSSAKHAAKDVHSENQGTHLSLHESFAPPSSCLTSSELLRLQLKSATKGKSNLNCCTSGVTKSQSNPSGSLTTALPVMFTPSSPKPSLPAVTEYHAAACFTDQSSKAAPVLQRSVLCSIKVSSRLKVLAMSLGTRLFGRNT